MDKLRQELSPLHIGKALDVATRDGAFAKEMYAGFGSCREIVALDRSDKMFEKVTPLSLAIWYLDDATSIKEWELIKEELKLIESMIILYDD